MLGRPQRIVLFQALGSGAARRRARSRGRTTTLARHCASPACLGCCASGSLHDKQGTEAACGLLARDGRDEGRRVRCSRVGWRVSARLLSFWLRSLHSLPLDCARQAVYAEHAVTRQRFSSLCPLCARAPLPARGIPQRTKTRFLCFGRAESFLALRKSHPVSLSRVVASCSSSRFIALHSQPSTARATWVFIPALCNARFARTGFRLSVKHLESRRGP